MTVLEHFDMNEAVTQIAREAIERKRYTAKGRPWHSRPRFSILQGKGSVIDPDGSIVWQDEDWMPNAVTNDGEADIISVYLKNGTIKTTWYIGLTLVSTATTNRPSNTTHATDLTQTALAGTTTVTEQNTGNGYARQSVAAAGWGANSGTQPTATTAPQVTFGPASTTAWSGTTTSPGQIQDAIVSSVASGTTGLLLLFLALSATTTIAIGQSFAYTLTFRVT